jgi:putative phage-type endonuclease
MHNPDDPARRAFLEERQSGLGGSDIGAIMGVDPWRNAMDVYFEKTRPVLMDETPSIDIMRGRLLEPIARTLYAEQTGRAVADPPELAVRHSQYEWAMVHPDGVLPNDNGALELKAPRARGYRNLQDYGARDSYIFQGMWACFVMRLEFCGFGFINMESDPMMTTFDVEVDDQLEDRALERADLFWHEHVTQRIPPKLEDWIRPDDLVLPHTIEKEDGQHVFVQQGDPLVEEAGARIYDVAQFRQMRQQATGYEEDAKTALRTFMQDNNLETATVEGAGKVHCRDREGRITLKEPLLAQSTPLDYDRTAALLLGDVAMHLSREELEPLLNNCVVDLDAYKKRGRSYNELRVYPVKGLIPEEV